MNHIDGFERLEARLWTASGDLRGNSRLASDECSTSIMGLLSLRHGSNRCYEDLAGITADKAAGKLPERNLVEAHIRPRRARILPDAIQDDTILERPMVGTLGNRFPYAIAAVEARFLPLAGQLPKDCEPLQDEFLDQILQTFAVERLQTAIRDVLGRAYDYPFADGSNPKPNAAASRAYLPKASGSLASVN